MGKEMTKMKNVEPMVDYKLQSEFQRKLRKQPLAVREKLKTMGVCCKKLIPGTGLVDVSVTRRDGRAVRAGFHGVCKCHNLWACPVCAAAALTEKCRQLTELLERLSEDFSAFMVTYTIPHTRRMPADYVIKKFQQVRRKGLHGVADKYQRCELECLGTVTTSEVTVTPYGFHLHQHILYVIPKRNWGKVGEYFRRVEAGWNGALMKEFENFDPATARTPAVWLSKNSRGEVLQVTDARYLYGYGVELTKSRRGKTQRLNDVRGSRTLFDLICGDEKDFDTLCEWLLASRMKHRITVSRGLASLLDKPLLNEKKTEDIETVVVGSFTVSGWNELVEAEIVTGLPLRYGVAKAAFDGYDSVVKFLARHRLDIQFLPSDRVFSRSPAPYEEIARDWDIRKRRSRYKTSRWKNARIHEDILAQMTPDEVRERNLKALKEYRRWARETYRNSVSISE